MGSFEHRPHAAWLAAAALCAAACSDGSAKPVGSADAAASSAASVSPQDAALGDAAVKKLGVVGLTPREHAELATELSRFGSPCDEPITLAKCIAEGAACKACVPAGKLVTKLVRLGAPAEQRKQFYDARFDPKTKKSIDLGDSPGKGAEDAPVTIVEWADFECSACAQMRPALDLMLERFPGQVRLVYKHFPLVRSHPNAMGAAKAGVAAHAQGKFWEMHRAMFDATSQGKGLAPQDLSRIAKKGVGLDMAEFRKVFSDDDTEKRIKQDMDQAEALGLEGTPFIWINGRLWEPMEPVWENFEEWVELEIQLAGKDPAKPSDRFKTDAEELGLGAPAPSSSAVAGASAGPSASAPAPSASAAPSAGPPPEK
jgi:protein-disulfide isomerase